MKRLAILGVAAAVGMSACTSQVSSGLSTFADSETPTTSVQESNASASAVSTPPGTTMAFTSTTNPPALPESFADFLDDGFGPQWGWIPGSSVEGDRSVIDVTFTDGRRIEMLYPAAWPLDEYGWTPDTNIVYEFDEPREDGSSVIHAQLLFVHGADGEWTFQLHPMSVWSNEELALAEAHVRLRKEANGFVTVTTTRPFSHYTRDPDQAPFNPDFSGGEAGMYVDDILGLSSTGPCIDDPANPYPTREPLGVTWCDDDAGVTVAFLVPEIYHDEILDNVDLQPVTAGPAG
jgi:hypothetical protein